VHDQKNCESRKHHRDADDKPENRFADVIPSDRACRCGRIHLAAPYGVLALDDYAAEMITQRSGAHGKE
jgi:hypothetical protein